MKSLFEVYRVSNAERKEGFSLIEMIGVLAIVAILSAVVLPKIFDAMETSRVNSTMVNINAVRVATTDFVKTYGTIPLTNNRSRIDDLLAAAGFFDQRFTAKIGSQADPYAAAGAAWTFNQSTGVWTSTGGASQNNRTRVIALTSNTTNPETAAGRNYQFDGTTSLPAGSRVVSAVLESVPADEARKLSITIDGASASAPDNTVLDGEGKIVYNTPNANTSLTDVFVYVAHL